MSPSQLLLKAYYERLHERMTAGRDRIVALIDRLLPAEIDMRGLGPLSVEQTQAYREACMAFLSERLETYNPIGIQYTFSRSATEMAAELEFQLNWYDSRAEFKQLAATARDLVAGGVSDEELPSLADRLILQAGAFPDRSIVAAYVVEPALQKLPDYILACAIEDVVRRR